MSVGKEMLGSSLGTAIERFSVSGLLEDIKSRWHELRYDEAALDSITAYDAIVASLAYEKTDRYVDPSLWRGHTISLANMWLNSSAAQRMFPGVDSFEITPGRFVTVRHYNAGLPEEMHRKVTLDDLGEKVNAERRRLGLSEGV